MNFINQQVLKLMLKKTEIKQIGSLKHCVIKPFGLHWVAGPLRSLGVYHCNSLNESFHLNFKPRIEKLKCIFNIWKLRNLSLKGKITIIKHLAIPQLLYISSALTVPTEVITLTNQIIKDFLWSGGTPKIKHNTIIDDIKHGGLKLTDFSIMVKSLKLTWLKRMMSGSGAAWLNIAQSYIPFIDIKDFIHSKCSSHYLPNCMPDFYKQVFCFWDEYPINALTNSNDYLNQSLWLNNNVKINKSDILERLV